MMEITSGGGKQKEKEKNPLYFCSSFKVPCKLWWKPVVHCVHLDNNKTLVCKRSRRNNIEWWVDFSVSLIPMKSWKVELGPKKMLLKSVSPSKVKVKRCFVLWCAALTLPPPPCLCSGRLMTDLFWRWTGTLSTVSFCLVVKIVNIRLVVCGQLYLEAACLVVDKTINIFCKKFDV